MSLQAKMRATVVAWLVFTICTSLARSKVNAQTSLVDTLNQEDQPAHKDLHLKYSRIQGDLHTPFEQLDFQKRRLNSLRADLGRRAADNAKRYNRLRADLGKRSAQEDGELAELLSSQEVFVPAGDVDAEKRGRSGFRGDLGKRAYTLRGDLGKRPKSFRGDLGKRAFRGDLGKRRSGFRGDLGKRDDEEEKRASRFRGDLGKRSSSVPLEDILELDGDDQQFRLSPEYDDDSKFGSFIDAMQATKLQNKSFEKLKTQSE